MFFRFLVSRLASDGLLLFDSLFEVAAELHRFKTDERSYRDLVKHCWFINQLQNNNKKLNLNKKMSDSKRIQKPISENSEHSTPETKGRLLPILIWLPEKKEGGGVNRFAVLGLRHTRSVDKKVSFQAFKKLISAANLRDVWTSLRVYSRTLAQTKGQIML